MLPLLYCPLQPLGQFPISTEEGRGRGRSLERDQQRRPASSPLQGCCPVWVDEVVGEAGCLGV